MDSANEGTAGSGQVLRCHPGGHHEGMKPAQLRGYKANHIPLITKLFFLSLLLLLL